MSFVGMVFIFIITVLVILSFTAVLIVRTIKGGRGKGAAMDDEETKIIQEIHAGLTRMEERVEALETILLEPETPQEPKPADNSLSD